MVHRNDAVVTMTAILAITFLPACGGPTSTPSESTDSPRASETPTSSSQLPVIDRTYRVGAADLDVSMRCEGEGSPTIVLEAGDDSSGDIFPLSLTEQLAERTRTCTYDRPGTGASDPPAEPRRTLNDVAQVLHELLERAGLEPPYVLAGSSGGGLMVLQFADRYPSEVAGIVLLDVPAPVTDLAKEFPGKMGWAGAENIDWPTSERAMALDPPNLGDTLVRIVTASEGQSSVKDQSFWLDLSSNAAQVELQGGHDVYLDDPDGVVEVILSVL